MALRHGDGTVFQRKDGKWIGRYRDGYTDAGAYRYRTVTGPTQKETERRLKAAVRKRREGEEAGLDPSMTVARWLETWLPIRQTKVAPKTYSDDASSARRWVIPALGQRKLAELTPNDLRNLTKAIKKGKPGKPAPGQATVKRAHEVLKAALKAATIEGYAVPSRLFMVEPPKKGIGDRAAIPVEDALKLLKAAQGDPYASRWVAALLNGLRQGEALGLTWDRVDLERGLIDVSWQLKELVYAHACQDERGKATCGKKRGAACPDRIFRVPDVYERRQVEGRWHLVRPKTKSGVRVLPLVPWMVDALKAWREVAPVSPAGLVWPASDGTVRDPKVDLAAFHALQDRAGVRHPSGRHYHVHEARHSTATILLALKVDTQIIIALMGHSSVLSSQAYMHTDIDMLRTALDGVAERLQLTS